MIPTPHIEVKDKDEFAKTVLMPGDPLRAEFIAKTFLTDVKKINNVRNMFGYTGYYKGHKISVMGSGMGMPSIGIYSYELYNFYGVENIIRIGSCGAYDPSLHVFDTILAVGAYSESSYAKTMNLCDDDVLYATKELNDELEKIASALNIELKKGIIHSSDVFYRIGGTDFNKLFQEHNCCAVEMESFALFANAKALGKKAACLLTVSDSFCHPEITTSEERQKSFTNMMRIALEMALC